MKRYKFQALVTLGNGEPDVAPSPRLQRMVLRAQHHRTHARKFFSALVASSGEAMPLPGDGPAIVTIELVGDDALEYFCIGGSFTLWQGSDIGSGVVTRRLFV